MQKKKNKGFTLIELLVVIAIIGILAAIGLSALTSARAKARDSKRKSDLREVSTALELYYADNGYYPEVNGYTLLLSALQTKGYISSSSVVQDPLAASNPSVQKYCYVYSSSAANMGLYYRLGAMLEVSTDSSINSISKKYEVGNDITAASGNKITTSCTF